MAQADAKEENSEYLFALHLEVQDGKWDEFIKNATILAKETNKEEGCISFNFYRKATDGDDKYKVELREHWKSLQDSDKHKETQHFKVTYLQNIVPILKERVIWRHYGNVPLIDLSDK